MNKLKNREPFMKKILAILGVTIAISGVMSCGKSGDGPVFKGRILTSTCDYITVQIADKYSPYGQDGWSYNNGTTTKKYDNVFRIANPCTYNPDGFSINDTFSFRFTGSTTQNCGSCLAVGPVPDTSYNIRVIRQ